MQDILPHTSNTNHKPSKSIWSYSLYFVYPLFGIIYFRYALYENSNIFSEHLFIFERN